jgi:hypothetical protein
LPGSASVSARPAFDLQCHSTYSDGQLTPSEVVAAAAAAGVELVALTDHDTVAGVPEARSAARRERVRLVTGVEISAREETARRDLHILGYLVDPDDPVLCERLERSRRARSDRAAAIVAALRELGFTVDEAALLERAAGGSIGRPHIAAAVLADPKNFARLRGEGRDTPASFFDGYLVPGAPAFAPRRSPSVGEAVAMIHAAGGVAVWAHPFWDVEDPAEVLATIERLRGDGLDGVECFYPSHSAEQAGFLADACAERGLLSTGSSDFHGPGRGPFGRFRAFSTHGCTAVLGPLAAVSTDY